MAPRPSEHGGHPAHSPRDRSDPVRTRRSPAWLAAGLSFAIALGYLLPRRAPGLTFEDSGLLASAAAVFGIPHPPGYPLWTMLGGVAVRLGSWFGMEPAAATNSLSTLAAAGACAVLAAFTAARCGSVLLGSACGLVLLSSNTFRSQAAVTEVYALATLTQLSFLSIALGTRLRPGRAGVALGLAASAHLASLLLAPLLLRSVRSLRAACAVAAGVFTGLLPFVYVPLRSLFDPAIDWGDPQTPARLLAHLGRAQYSGSFEPDRAGALVFAFDQGPWQLAGPLLLALGLAGWLMARRDGSAAKLGWLVATASIAGVGLMVKAVYPEMLESVRWRLAGSYQVLVAILATFVAVSFSGAVQGRWNRPPVRIALTFALIAAGWFAPTPRTALPFPMDSARGADRFARDLFEQAPPNAFVWINRLGATDVLGFPLLYRQVALGERPDLVLIDRTALELAWYREQLAARAPELRPALANLGRLLDGSPQDASPPAGGRSNDVRLRNPAARRRASGLVFQAARASQRPLVATDPPGQAILGERPLVPSGLLWWDTTPAEADRVSRVDLTGEPRSPWTDMLDELAERRAQP